MKKVTNCIWTIVWAVIITGCASEENIYLSLGLDDNYVVERMRPLTLSPGYEGDRYEWRLSYRIDDEEVADSLVSTSRDYTFVGHRVGTYRLSFYLSGSTQSILHYMTIGVREEGVAYSPYITRVLEYRPAPGQFVNEMPPYVEGDTEETMRRKAEESLAYNAREMVSLGGYGGYITIGFDHTIVNRSGECDFKILGNAFYDVANPRPDAPLGGSCEPGIVMVSLDVNGNRLPDDEWYELAGSEYHSPETLKEYEITYYRPDEHKIPTSGGNSYYTDVDYIRWTDNRQAEGYIPKMTFHTQPYFPQWLRDDELTFKGTRLADNGVDESGDGTHHVLYAYDYGYADNHPNMSEKSNFDIDWAVNRSGESVHLPGIDFIRIYTAVNQSNGKQGECSTEVMGVTDLHLEEDK